MKIATAAYCLSSLNSFVDYSEKIRSWVADAAQQGAQLLVFPEYGAIELASLGGPEISQDLEASLRETAKYGADVQALHCELAALHGIYILGGSGPFFAGARPVNRAVFYGPQGVIGHQDKQIMTRFERDVWGVVPGQGLQLFDTPLGRVGVVICYDSEFPMLARALVDAGAEILLAPSCTDTLAGFNRVRVGAMARALENQCVVVHAPLVGEHARNPAVQMNIGAASVYGPSDKGFPDSGILAELPLNQPGWAIADISLDAIREVRADGRVLNHLHWGEQAERTSAPVSMIKC